MLEKQQTPCRRRDIQWGKVEERRKEVTGLICEFPLPCAQCCLNSNQAQGAWLSVRALVQAVTQKGNLSWSGVWSGHFEVISFSKEIISFVCTCSGKVPHWRLFSGHLDHNCFVQKSSMTGNEKKKKYYKWLGKKKKKSLMAIYYIHMQRDKKRNQDSVKTTVRVPFCCQLLWVCHTTNTKKSPD